MNMDENQNILKNGIIFDTNNDTGLEGIDKTQQSNFSKILDLDSSP